MPGGAETGMEETDGEAMAPAMVAGVAPATVVGVAQATVAGAAIPVTVAGVVTRATAAGAVIPATVVTGATRPTAVMRRPLHRLRVATVRLLPQRLRAILR